MQSIDKEAITLALQKFKQFKDLQALEFAANHVNTLQPRRDVTQVNELQIFHKEKLNLWITIFSHIDQEIDPKFDIKDTPMLSVVPPEGAKVPAGADPQSIKDPELRLRYIQDIKLNKDSTARYNFQYKLLKLNALSMDDLRIYVGEIYLENLAAKNRYLQIVEQTTLTLERKVALKNLVQL